jgi:phage terminase large subunit-like protein
VGTRAPISAECMPRWATPRTRRRTLASQVADVARQLDLRLLPWQRLVLSVGLERSGRRPAYRDVLVSVPRQSGKSSLALVLIVWKLLSTPGARVAYSAQTRLAAREKMLSTWWPRLVRSPLADRARLYRGYGAETISLDNGSVLQLLSAAESAGHGETLDLAIVDEAWVHQDAAIEQAIRPTMVTRRDAQLWAMSTAGTSRSVWWKGKLDAGRAAAKMGVDDWLCLLEWCADDDADPTDEAAWWQAMPALGRLIDPDTIRADLQNMPPAEFRRAYLNLWPSEEAEGWQVFDRGLWAAARGA